MKARLWKSLQTCENSLCVQILCEMAWIYMGSHSFSCSHLCFQGMTFTEASISLLRYNQQNKEAQNCSSRLCVCWIKIIPFFFALWTWTYFHRTTLGKFWNFISLGSCDEDSCNIKWHLFFQQKHFESYLQMSLPLNFNILKLWLCQ